MKRFATITGYVVGLMLLVSVIIPGQVEAAAPTPSIGPCPSQNILGFPAWFNGLQCTWTPNPWDTTNPNSGTYAATPTTINDTWIIVMNVVQWLILTGGYIALYFIIWSGFKFITAEGEPDQIKQARQTITNAVIGLIIVLVAVAVVRTIQTAVLTGVAK